MEPTPQVSPLALSANELAPDEPPGAGPADRPQHELTLFLHLELCHSLGSYGRTALGMRALQGRMTLRGAVEPWSALFPSDALERMASYNESLRANLHLPTELRKTSSALLEPTVPSQHPNPGENLGGDDIRYQWVLDFYQSAILALGAVIDGAPKRKFTAEQKTFGQKLKLVHDPQRRGEFDHADDLARGRIARNSYRLERAKDLFGLRPHEDRSREIVADHLGAGQGGAPLHTQVVGALVEAHIRMHRAEHLLSHSFGDKMRRSAEIDEAVTHDLERSVALNTFAYAASRTAPWIFSAREEERDYVLDNYVECCDTLTPTYCMWLAKQVTLLALHRRAFTWHLLGKGDKAHNDFQKVKRLVRDIERQLEERILTPAGAHIFLRGLSAFADHHSGRIYTAQHAHSAALRHFDRAALQLGRLERDPEAKDILCNSRWRIHLLINQAKASYELGLMKQTLVGYIRAWRAFLELGDTESSARANFQVIDRLIEWLEGVQPDAEMNKLVLVERLTPLVQQLQVVVRGPAHLRVLAAEILMRLAHVLFILKLPAMSDGEVKRDLHTREPITDQDLAYRCLLQAARLDRSQTLIAADLLKARQWNRPTPAEPNEPEFVRLEEQWSGGGGQFEEATRVVEYVLQSWLLASDPKEEAMPKEKIARDLFVSFLAHTDSTNVKLAQVYRYLMQEATASKEEGAECDSLEMKSKAALTPSTAYAPAHPEPQLELICLRRYSSFFPFVPRPMAFRVLGGGYFLRVCSEPGEAEETKPPFGIAIDPGPNFIDNLYRTGYCLADVHMILVTHDHADHMAALDPMLALFGYRLELLDETFGHDHMLAIVGNDSVRTRYLFYNENKDDPVRVFTFSQWAELIENGSVGEGSEILNREEFLLPPPTLRIEPVQTFAHVDAGGHAAQGMLVSAGSDERESSILFTSDSGPFLPKQRSARRRPSKGRRLAKSPGMNIREAIDQASVVVVHVSAIPLPQLRVFTGLMTVPNRSGKTSRIETVVRNSTREFNQLWKALYAQIKAAEKQDPEHPASRDWAERCRFVVRQLQFGFHSSPDRKKSRDVSGLDISPLSPHDELAPHSGRHLYFDGLMWVAERIAKIKDSRLLLIGELHEELGTFRTRIARALNDFLFDRERGTRALTADIGLTVHITGKGPDAIKILCTTCALDNDLVGPERFHSPKNICEVCVKGEDEGIFFNCDMHDPQRQPEPAWVERVERYDPFGR